MEDRKILVMSEAMDMHGRAVRWGLQEIGGQVHWWDRTLTPIDDTISVTLNDISCVALAIDGAAVTLDAHAYKAIWNRRGQEPTVEPNLRESDKVLARHESKFLLEGIVASLEYVNQEALIINSLGTRVAGNSKLHQLVVAQKVGFRIPDTLVSNNPEDIRRFAEKLPSGIIAKMHIPYSWRDEKGVVRISGTMPIAGKDLMLDEPLKSAPMIYQEKLAAHTELRVVVFGKTALAIAQTRPATSKQYVDLRWEDVINASEYTVGEELKKRCLDFMGTLGLSYAAFDILVAEDGTETFLEANECGQFLYLEEKVPEVTILDAFCQYLASGSPDFEYVRPSGLTLERYLATDDARDCRELLSRHWNESDKFSPFELAD